MNKFKLILTAPCLLIISCSKAVEINDEIEGHWILTGTSGSFLGGGIDAKWDRIVIEDGDFELFGPSDDTDELHQFGDNMRNRFGKEKFINQGRKFFHSLRYGRIF